MTFLESLGGAVLLLLAAMFGSLVVVLVLSLFCVALPFTLCIFLVEEHPEPFGILTLLALCFLLVL